MFQRSFVNRRRLILALAFACAGGVIWWCWDYGRDFEREAAEALRRGDLSATERALVRLNRRRPHDPDVLQFLAEVTARRGATDQSLAWFQQSAAVSKDPAAAYLEAGVRAFTAHRAATAERCYREAIAAKPTWIRPWAMLARLQLVCRRAVDLRRTLADADRQQVPLEDDPTLLWLWVVGDTRGWQTDDAEQWLTAALQASPDDPWLQAAAAGNGVQTARPELAKPLFDSLQVNRAENWPLRLVAARAAFESSDSAAAAGLLAGLPAESDADVRGWLLRGELLAAADQHQDALAMFEQALAVDPLCAPAAQWRARELTRLHRTADAEAQFQRMPHHNQLLLSSMRLLQDSTPGREDAFNAARLGFELGQSRWAELVCRLIDRQYPHADWPAELKGRRQQADSREPLPRPPASSPQTRELARRFDALTSK